MKTEKKCRGIGKALGSGCGSVLPKVFNGQSNHQYGLGKSCGCFLNWIKSTPSGQDFAVNQGLSNVKKVQSEQKKQNNGRLREMRIETYGKEHRKYMNDEMQKLSRKIDAALGHTTCIDCSKPFGKQVDGGHFHSKGANPSLSWNLHNLHSQKSDCNQNGIGGGKALGYYEGLIERYGEDYAHFVRFDMVRLYPVIKMSNREVYEKLELVRGINRNFDTYVLPECGIKARRMFNLLIGIYSE